MGIMQSDPNPSNFTFNVESKKLNLFDFGATHIYNQTFLNHYCKIINASVESNKEEIVKQSILTGFLTNEENAVMLENHIQSIMVLGEPLRWKGIYDFGNQAITQKIYKTIPLLLKNRLKSPPE
jgi:aarF domain-containing kinase